MASIQKRKNQNGTSHWRAIVRIKGYPTVCNHFERKQEAEDWAADIERQIKLGQYKPERVKASHTFSDLVARFLESGALEHHKQDKGPVLIAFLENIAWRPSKILFLDDRLDYLQSVEEALEGTGIEFIGFHYTQVADHPCIVNESLANLQFMHLAKTGIWLSDNEVKCLSH